MSLIVDIRKKTGSFNLDVSFETEGGVHALLGSSGSGKSMTLKCIAGILTPDEGYIELDGRVLFDSGRRVNLPPRKRNVGYMFQDYALFPTMTVLRNVMEAMGNRRQKQKAEEYLRRFHVLELADRLPGRLSGGQKQRVAMARIAAQEPSLVLLDEPFSALDSHLNWVLQNEMKMTLQEMGCPAVLVTHSRDEVYRLCTSVCCLQEGHSEKTQSVHAFFRNPETVAGAKLSGCKNVSPVQVLDDHRLYARDWDTVLFFRNGIPEDVRPWLFAAGIRAHRFHAEQRPEDDNMFIPQDAAVMEDPFEWNILFHTDVERTVPGEKDHDRDREKTAAGEECKEEAEEKGMVRKGAGVKKQGIRPETIPPQPLLWRIAKTPGTGKRFPIPARIYLSSEDIMFLRR